MTYKLPKTSNVKLEKTRRRRKQHKLVFEPSTDPPPNLCGQKLDGSD